MSTKRVTAPEVSRVTPKEHEEWRVSELLKQYGCGPIPFVGSESAFYERHLVFDRVIDPHVATARERFEAVAHSIRDVLAQRWMLTKSTYNKTNPKRVYYLSMEFLLGRSLTNNITNLLVNPLVQQAVQEKGIDWLELIEQVGVGDLNVTPSKTRHAGRLPEHCRRFCAPYLAGGSGGMVPLVRS